MAEVAAWEKQKGETEKAYEAFAMYRDAGEGRTLRAVSQRLQKSYTLIRRWEKRWDWKERVREYDNSVARDARAKAVKDRKDMIDRHIRIGMAMQQKALEALAATEASALTPRDIKEFVREATELERASRTAALADQDNEGRPESLVDAIVEAFGENEE